MCFQKHLLPQWAGKLVGRTYFWPCIPCTIYGNKVEFKGQWWAHVDDEPPEVLLGQAPLFLSQLRDLEKRGVKAIINLCDEFKGRSRYYKVNGINLLWLRTVDHLEPTVEAMNTACDFIEKHRKKGHGVYIHCKSGRGRSAAIAMAWLMHYRKMSPQQAQEHLLRQRKVRSKLYRQKNVIQFYENMGGFDGDVELGDINATRQHRTISFATVVPKPTLDTHACGETRGMRRNSTARAREILRAPLHDIRADEYGVDDRPPDWEEQAGVWEINVAPLETEFEDDGPRQAPGGRQAFPPRFGRKSRQASRPQLRQPPPPLSQGGPRESQNNAAGLVSTAV